VFLELVLRFLPVGNAVLLAEVASDPAVKRYRPGSEIVWSAGWNFALRTRKRVDSLGYTNDQPMPSPRNVPAMVIIGDSYVEALQVDNRQAHHALLNESLEGRGHVRGIGTSGSPLSNYLVYAELAKKELDPTAIAIVVVGNDFDESMCSYFNGGVGMWCFHERAGRAAELVPMQPPQSTLRNLARNSALLRYLVFNLHLNWRRLVPKWGDAAPDEAFVGNVSARVDDSRLKASERAVDLFLERLSEKAGLAPNRILLVLDGIRQHIYDPGKASVDSFFARMRSYFIDQASAHGFEVLDLQPVFESDYARNSERFEFSIDGHWNRLGHWVVANAITRSKVFEGAFGEADLGDRSKAGQVR